MSTFVSPYPSMIGADAPGFQWYAYFGEPDQDSVANPKQITDENGTPLANPQICNERGQCSLPIRLDGEYSIEVWDGDAAGTGSLKWRVERFAGVLSESELNALGVGQGTAWSATETYSEADIVQGSDLRFYQSTTSLNLGNDPTLGGSDWTRYHWFQSWDSGVTYNASMEDIVLGSDGVIYKSLIEGNINNDPTADITATNWESLVNKDVTYHGDNTHNGQDTFTDLTTFDAGIKSNDDMELGNNTSFFNWNGHRIIAWGTFKMSTNQVLGARGCTVEAVNPGTGQIDINLDTTVSNTNNCKVFPGLEFDVALPQQTITYTFISTSRIRIICEYNNAGTPTLADMDGSFFVIDVE